MPVTSPPQWIVAADEIGVRLDKYLAAPSRLKSRRRVSVALERGQVFVNDKETGLTQAGTPLASGDVVRLSMIGPAARSGTAGRLISAACASCTKMLRCWW